MANPEALTIPQEGGPELIVPKRSVETFHALEVLTKGEDVPPQFILAAMRDDRVHPDDLRRSIVGLAKAERSIEVNPTQLVYVEGGPDTWKAHIAETDDESGLVVSKTRRHSKGLKLNVGSVDTINYDGSVEATDSDASIDMAVPRVFLNNGGDKFPRREMYKIVDPGGTILIIGQDAIDQYLQEQAEGDVDEDLHDMPIEFSDSLTLLALAKIRERGYHLPVMSSEVVMDRGVEAVAKMVVMSLGIETSLTRGHSMEEYLKRLPGVGFGQHDMYTIAEKVKEFIEGDEDAKVIRKAAKANGGDFEELITDQSKNILHNLLGSR